MIKQSQNISNQVEVIDATGYYAEQFLCRQAAQMDRPYGVREEILDHIYLAVNMIEEIGARGLDSVVVDISTDVSGMVSQLMMRGFKKVIAIPETEQSLEKLRAECEIEGWNVKMDVGSQSDSLELLIDKIEKSVDVIAFMDSNFGRFSTKETQKAVIEKCAKLLSTDGLLILDISNPIERIRNMLLTPQGDEDEKFYYLTRESINPFTFEYRTTNIEIEKKSGKQSVKSETGFLIPLPTIREMLTESGLSIKKVFGNYEQDPFTANSTRMIVIAGI